MKKYTRFLAFLLAIAMLLSCSTSAFAENAGLSDEYYQFIEEYLNAQYEAAIWSPDPVLSDSVLISIPFTDPAPLMKSSAGNASTFSLRATEPTGYAMFAASRAIGDEVPTDPDGNSVYTLKKATANGDGTYNVRIEAFSTGSTFTTTTEEAIPTDIILVLDQSTSMETDDMTSIATEAQFRKFLLSKTNSEYFSETQKIYYKLSDTNYVQVQVERTVVDAKRYEEINKPTSNNQYGQYRTLLRTHSNNGVLYYKKNNEYRKVTVTTYWANTNYGQREFYRYSDAETGETIEEGIRVDPGNNSNRIPDTTFYEETFEYSYKYYYTTQDEDGELVQHSIIDASAGADTTPLTEDSGYRFYYYQAATQGGETISRIEALRSAVQIFADSVTEKAESENIDHRIAIVGFATGYYSNNTSSYPRYENTEVLTLQDSNGNAGVNYNSNPAYGQAFQNMNSADGQEVVSEAIEALQARGATHVDLGMEMATKIFEEDTVDTFVDANGTVRPRNKVVILFSDGQPSEWDDYDEDIADDAIEYSEKLINDYDATVYSIGVFKGAYVGNPAALPGNNTSNNNHVNRFLHLVSSNYPDATAMDDQYTGQVNADLNGGSYYLVATNGDELNTIFEKINDSIEEGKTSVTLDSDATVKDIVSEFFLPINGDATNITLKTAAYAGNDSDGSYTWEAELPAESAITPVVNGSSVSVTGFSFKDEYITIIEDDPVGRKLIIEFTINPKEDFLGGNGVPTNGAESGIYDADNIPADIFEIPDVVVPAKPIIPTIHSQHIYLGNQPNLMAMIGFNTTQTFREYRFTEGQEEAYNIDGTNNAYADVIYEFLVEDDNGSIVIDDKNYTLLAEYQIDRGTAAAREVSENAAALAGIKVDTRVVVRTTVDGSTYKLDESGEKVLVGTENKASSVKDAMIYVSDPVLTFKDSVVDYQQEISNPDYFNANNRIATVEWKHDPVDNLPGLSGTAPTLDIAYAPVTPADLEDNKVSTVDDIPVKVTEIKKNGSTFVYYNSTVNELYKNDEELGGSDGFKHETCSVADCTWSDSREDGAHFLLHVRTGELKIEKIVQKLDDKTAEPNPNDEFTFTVSLTYPGDTEVTRTEFVTIKAGKANAETITKLPGGTKYSIVESSMPPDYTASTTEPIIDTITAEQTEEVQFTNTYTKPKVGNLKITKTDMEEGESAIFKVKINGEDYATVVLTGPNASATLVDLEANARYEVVEDSWSWSYTQGTAKDASGEIPAGGTAEATFSNTKNEQWLYDESAAVNTYADLATGTNTNTKTAD